jgi:hypothetical protein
MIRIDVAETKERRGVFHYRVSGMPVEGRSRQPLLDACRQIKRILGPSAHRAGLFREGRTIADLSCLIDEGARLTVRDESNGGIHFAQYREFDRTALLEAVE